MGDVAPSMIEEPPRPVMPSDEQLERMTDEAVVEWLLQSERYQGYCEGYAAGCRDAMERAAREAQERAALQAERERLQRLDATLEVLREKVAVARAVCRERDGMIWGYSGDPAIVAVACRLFRREYGEWPDEYGLMAKLMSLADDPEWVPEWANLRGMTEREAARRIYDAQLPCEITMHKAFVARPLPEEDRDEA